MLFAQSTIVTRVPSFSFPRSLTHRKKPRRLALGCAVTDCTPSAPSLWNDAACSAVGGVRARRSYVLAVLCGDARGSEVLTACERSSLPPRRSSRRRGPHQRSILSPHQVDHQDNPLLSTIRSPGSLWGHSRCNTGTVSLEAFNTGGAV